MNEDLELTAPELEELPITETSKLKQGFLFFILLITTLVFCGQGFGYNVFNDKYLSQQTEDIRIKIGNEEQKTGYAISKNSYIDYLIHNVTEDQSKYILGISTKFGITYTEVDKDEYDEIELGTKYKINSNKIYGSLQEAEEQFNNVYYLAALIESMHGITQQICESYAEN